MITTVGRYVLLEFLFIHFFFFNDLWSSVRGTMNTGRLETRNYMAICQIDCFLWENSVQFQGQTHEANETSLACGPIGL